MGGGCAGGWPGRCPLSTLHRWEVKAALALAAHVHEQALFTPAAQHIHAATPRRSATPVAQTGLIDYAKLEERALDYRPRMVCSPPPPCPTHTHAPRPLPSQSTPTRPAQAACECDRLPRNVKTRAEEHVFLRLAIVRQAQSCAPCTPAPGPQLTHPFCPTAPHPQNPAPNQHATHDRQIICGASAYPRDWDYERLRGIANKAGAYLMCDMAHTR